LSHNLTEAKLDPSPLSTPTAPRSLKMSPFRFCLFGCKLQSTMDDPDVYKRPGPLAHEDSTLWHNGLATPQTS